MYLCRSRCNLRNSSNILSDAVFTPVVSFTSLGVFLYLLFLSTRSKTPIIWIPANIQSCFSQINSSISFVHHSYVSAGILHHSWNIYGSFGYYQHLDVGKIMNSFSNKESMERSIFNFITNHFNQAKKKGESTVTVRFLRNQFWRDLFIRNFLNAWNYSKLGYGYTGWKLDSLLEDYSNMLIVATFSKDPMS